MRTPEDVSACDGQLVLAEYSEQHPPLLMSTGMATRIKNYYRRPEVHVPGWQWMGVTCTYLYSGRSRATPLGYSSGRLPTSRAPPISWVNCTRDSYCRALRPTSSELLSVYHLHSTICVCN